MKKARINLHMDFKKAALLVVLFSVISFAVDFLVAFSVKDGMSQLISSLHSDYIYSVCMKEPISDDSYYKYSAGICFTESADSKTSINADVIMQGSATEYSDAVYWNAEQLDADSVALSLNIAKAYGLDVGDSLFSKHIVTDTVSEYKIVQIIPAVSTARLIKGNRMYDGIIIMGYDERYAENISHTGIVFTNLNLAELQTKYSEMPVDILYREDEIATSIKSILPYSVLAMVLSVSAIVVLVCFLTKIIGHNYKRQISLGYEEQLLRKSFNRTIGGLGLLSIIVASLLELAAIFVIGNMNSSVSIIILVMVVELAALLIAVSIFRRRLWRK